MTSASLAIAIPHGRMESPLQGLPPNANPVLHRTMRAAALRFDWAARAMGNASATAQVFALGIDAESMEELLQMQQAAWRRLLDLQSGWMEEWKSWIAYADQIKGANTMSKLAERENNIVAQLTQILGNQATDLVGLQENIHVDYSYWINQKLSEKRKSLPAYQPPSS